MKSRTEFGQPIFIIDADFNIRKCSRHLKSILNITHESEAVGHTCYQLFYGQKQPCHMCPAPRAVLLKSVVEQDMPRRSSFDAVATPIQNADGAVQHLIMDCLGDDVSMHRKKNSAAEHSHEAIVQSLPASQTVLLDRDKTVVLYSQDVKAFNTRIDAELLGRSVFSVAPYYNRPEIRQPLEDFYRGELNVMVFETDDTALGGGQTQHFAEKLDGHRHVDAVLLRSTAVEQNGHSGEAYLAEHLKMLSQFASHMAHDVKNALALISTNADFIVSESTDPNPHDEYNNITRYAEIIQKHVKQIVGIVEQANLLKVHNWDVTAESDLAQLLNRVVTITQLSKPYVSHDIRLMIEGHLPRIVTAELYLERALTELVKAVLLNSEEHAPLVITLNYIQRDAIFRLTLTSRQQSDLLSNIEQKLRQFYVMKKQWDPAVLGLIVAYAAILTQGGSMQSTLLDNGDFRLTVKLPRAPQTH